MKIKLSNILNLLTAVLIFATGLVLGYRFGEKRLASKINIPFISAVQGQTNQNSHQGMTLGDIIGSQESANKQVDFDVFWEAWSYLENDYLETEKINSQNMVDGAIVGMTAALGDPYTMYLPPKDNQRSGEDLAGSFYGVGIELGYEDRILAVMSPLEGMPADLAGVKAGDLILHVKDPLSNLDEDTTGWSLIEGVEKIRGKKGTEVTLTLYRENFNDNKPFEVNIRRDEIIVESVKLEFIEKNGQKIAHIKLMRFGERTLDEWDMAINAILLQKNNLAGIILDMRNNPGGFFDTSIDIASDFVQSNWEKKTLIVSQKGKYKSQDFPPRFGKGRLIGIKTVVVVNKGSASASEIVAGALRDNLQTKLIGERTFGKGTVQDRRELSNGGGLHITIGRWMMPNGEWIHDEGIPVDVEVQDDEATEQDEVIDKAVEEFN